MNSSINPPIIVSSTTVETSKSIYNFLKDSPVGVLSSVTKDGQPYGVVIYYHVDDDFMFSFVTKKATTTHHNLESNKDVVLVVYDSFSQTTVQITAKAEVITDNDVAEQAFNRTLEAAKQSSDSGVPPITKMWAGDYVAYSLRPSHIQMRVFVRPDPSGYDLFSTIDFR